MADASITTRKEPRTPSRKSGMHTDIDTERFPPKLNKFKRSKPMTLHVLVREYNSINNRRDVRQLERLIKKIFEYLQSYFDRETSKRYYSELVKTLEENYGKHRFNLAHDILASLKRITEKERESDRTKETLTIFKPIIEELKDDEAAITLSDEDLQDLIDYVKQKCVGDECGEHDDKRVHRILHGGKMKTKRSTRSTRRKTPKIKKRKNTKKNNFRKNRKTKKSMKVRKLRKNKKSKKTNKNRR